MSKKFRKQDESYELSSSDDEYDSNEKILLDKFRNRRKEDSESETEVFGVGSESDSDDADDNQSDIALSDVEGQEQDDDLPDVRAWGKEKKKYYGTDYVDPDYGGFQEKDAHAAEIEEEEAKNLQSQLVQQLDDDDFSLDVIFKKKENESVKEQHEELVKTDLSKLSEKQKIQILQKESPEFFALVEDFKVKMTLAKEYLQPIMELFRNGKIEKCRAVKFVETHYNLILNYASNVYMYLLLKGNKELKNHPIIQRLYQYRTLLGKLEPVFEDVIKPQIELILAENSQEQSIDKQESLVKTKKKKVLKIIQKLQNEQKTKKSKPDGIQPKKKIKLDETVKEDQKVTFEADNSDQDDDMDVDQEGQSDYENELNKNAEEVNADGMSKRAITYQISKNKGLTPHRKKELRNPRVKHKIKFRKALIRRKGAVREPRKELKRYNGEISGIKTTVSKSIKIKT